MHIEANCNKSPIYIYIYIYDLFLISVQLFLLQTSDETRLLIGALAKIPSEKTGEQYIKWMAQTKALIESMMLKDQVALPLLHTFFRHLEVKLFQWTML